MNINTLTILLVLFVGYQLTTFICFKEHRIISDREHLEKFVGSMLKSGRVKLHSWDNTVETYLSSHPDCCSVSRIAFLNMSDADVQIGMNYEMSEQEKASGGHGNNTHYDYISFLDACGKQFDSTGESYTPSP